MKYIILAVVILLVFLCTLGMGRKCKLGRRHKGAKNKIKVLDLASQVCTNPENNDKKTHLYALLAFLLHQKKEKLL